MTVSQDVLDRIDSIRSFLGDTDRLAEMFDEWMGNKTWLYLDFETFSRLDLTKVGSVVYSEHESTEAMLLAYAFDDEPVELIDFTRGDRMPKRLRDALLDPDVIKSCWNKTFEYNIFKNVMGIHVPHAQWFDTMILAYHMSFPGQLDKVGPAIGLAEEFSKMKGGKALINKFSKPRTPTAKKPWTRESYLTEPDLWEDFCDYNVRDVETERAASKWLRKWGWPSARSRDKKWKAALMLDRIYWELDQEINDRGVPVNVKAALNATKISDAIVQMKTEEMQAITNLANPNSPKQLIPWLRERGYMFLDLKKANVRKALEKPNMDSDVVKVLKLRQEVSKTSVKKYDAILRAVSPDGRIRNMLQFGGAQRTNRFAGRVLQVQNLPSPAKSLEDQQEETARVIEIASPEMFNLLYDKPMDALATGIRPMIQAEEGYMFDDADLSAIENRVLGWLARDEKILSVFRDKRDPYIAFAVHMTGRTYEDLWHEYKEEKNKTNRTLAKPPTLGCFGPNTLVLTRKGWKPIIAVREDDQVHDGIDWVSHSGVVYQGHKKTINLMSVVVTPDHQVAYAGHPSNTVLGGTIYAPASVLKKESYFAERALHFAAIHHPPTRPILGSTEYPTPDTSDVYDVTNAGPRNRFTILSDRGPLIVHNCGYMLGVGDAKLNKKTGEMEYSGLQGYAQNMGVHLTPAQAKHAVDVFRGTFTDVVAFWKDLENAVRKVMSDKTGETSARVGFLEFDRRGPFLRMILPSGRPMYYFQPRMEMRETPWGQMKMTFTYKGVNDKKIFTTITTHPGKWAEQCTQAASRDVLLHGMYIAHELGMYIIFHVHDQIITMEPEELAPERIHWLNACMGAVPEWAPGLILGSEGAVTRVFQKD